MSRAAPTAAEETRAWSAWRAAAARPEIDAALLGLYADVDAAIAERGPTCWTSGNCCRFVEFGHRLYVTALEVAWFTRQVAAGAGPTGAEPTDRHAGDGAGLRLPQFAETAGACPYQAAGRCTTHRVRPLGCRIFFCQTGTEDWQQSLYEDFLRRLRALHDEHGVAYCYLDWIAGLDAASATWPAAG